MIGAGRFGKVYRARRQTDGQTVAIKYLRKDFLNNPEIVERFIEEARTLAKLDHPGIVRTHGLGKTRAGNYFIVMEWIDGPNLATLVHAEPLGAARVLRWLSQVSLALAHAHERGILHCDLKPSNLIINREDNIFVSDFGLAQPLVQSVHFDDRIFGTPAFMAPEQVAEWWGPVTARTDVYGLGAVLFTLLTGQSPWPETRLPDILARIISTDAVRSANVLRPGIPSRINMICVRCLAKRPSERYANMKELHLALAECVR
jgi:serine/threonine protein kinase